MGVGRSAGTMLLAVLIAPAPAIALVACTSDVVPTSASREVNRETEPTEAPAAPLESGPTEPLVLVVNRALPAPRITSADARALLEGRMRSWLPIDGTSTPLTLLRGDGDGRRLSPVGVLRRVSRDRRAVGVLRGWDVTPQVRAMVVDGVDPLRRPAAYPLQSPGAVPGPVTTIVAIHSLRVGARPTVRGTGGRPVPLREWRAALRRADLALGTLESAAPQAAAALADAGLDAVSMANERIGDQGVPALRATIAGFRRGPVRGFGAGTSRQGAGETLELTRNGVRLGLVAFNAAGGTPRATSTGPGVVSVLMPPEVPATSEADLRFLERRVKRLDGDTDVVVVVPRWSQDSSEGARSGVTERLVAAGADLVLGSHGTGFVDAGTTAGGGGLVAVIWGTEAKAVELVAGPPS